MIRRLSLSACWMLASASLHGQGFTTVLSGGDPANRVDIALIGDGYTAGQRAQFDLDVAEFVDRALAQAPFSQYRGFLNVHSVFVASNQAGSDHSNRTPQVFVDTALDGAFNCSSIQRLVCVSVAKVNAALAPVLSPNRRDIVVVIVNDLEYGGSGGAVAVTSRHPDGIEVVLHEVGHSFGLLADEYTSNPPACNATLEPAAANATLVSVRGSIKWLPWIAITTAVPTGGTSLGVPGLYQGSDYCPTSKYRPTYDSKMRTLGRAFDQINTEQFIKRFYNLVSPIDSTAPAPGLISMSATESRTFSVATPALISGFNFAWVLDNVTVSQASTFTLNGANLTAGSHILDVQVSDPTTLVRTDTLNLLRETSRWTIQAAGGGGSSPITTINAATLQAGPIAPDSFAAAQGARLASGVGPAGVIASTNPYPTNLGGSTVKVKDALGVERLAPLYFVSAAQINYVVPVGTAAGTATVTITAADGTASVGTITVAPVAPGLITFGGTNIAAANVVRVRSGVQTVENVYTVSGTGSLVAAPIDLGPDTDTVVLLLYGTGIRNRTALNRVSITAGGVPITVDYAGAQSQYPALDQVNITLPRTLVGKGDIVIQLTADGLAANPVHVTIK